MKQSTLILLITILVLYFGSSAQAQSVTSDGVAIRGKQVAATEPFVCDGAQHVAEWIADQNLQIFKSQVWVGISMGGRGDFFYSLKVKETNNMLNMGSWDHYAEPTSLNSDLDKNDFAPNYIIALQGQTIRLMGICNASSVPVPSAQLSATIWYVGY